MTLQIKKLDFTKKDDLNELKIFIDQNPNSCRTFRYFKSRPFEIIKNHLHTFLYYENESCVGYGHLDFEEGKAWLGIMVSDSFHSKGIGNQIMDHLISFDLDEIYLSVDKENTAGTNLYKKKNFIIFKENDKNYLMILKKI